MMKLTEFDFELPEELIALRPVKPRSSSRLLLSRGLSPLGDFHFYDLPKILSSGDRLVINDTKVIAARLRGVRQRPGSLGCHISVNLDQPLNNQKTIWLALARPARRIRVGDRAEFGHIRARFIERRDQFFVIQFCHSPEEFETLLMDSGEMPLPPYITSARPPDAADSNDYQTVFGERNGAVASPTASLHFDENLLEQLRQSGIQLSRVTLHVGAGTFLPIRGDTIDDHEMHAEWGEISEQAADEINQSLAAGERVIPIGTTALRLIETAAQNGHVQPWRGQTQLYIKPGFDFEVAKGLITNFHLPGTTLLVLVAAFVGIHRFREIYRHAVSHRYRFLSYGDGSLLLP